MRRWSEAMGPQRSMSDIKMSQNISQPTYHRRLRSAMSRKAEHQKNKWSTNSRKDIYAAGSNLKSTAILSSQSSYPIYPEKVEVRSNMPQPFVRPGSRPGAIKHSYSTVLSQYLKSEAFSGKNSIPGENSNDILNKI